MIRIGETHAVMHGEWPEVELDANADEAVRVLVIAARSMLRAWRDPGPIGMAYEIPRAATYLADALAPFTDPDVALVDSGLRSCATPETSAIKGDDHG